ncbi:Pycsar system effector family protein [Streptomyces sp. Amel2xC10]|uniref:Pycsar system effector family protein n=1 Tax=Streptomyces sp. Amel2xC10 TaxID=1305826 RepID=UPI000A082421|nr:Pycsar system effector family protein [Streptomyces sp. Amel2xC10]SME91514.1 hypothetical protein SAMN02745830_00422 [Streptomyces sp. Amel2xC10]
MAEEQESPPTVRPAGAEDAWRILDTVRDLSKHAEAKAGTTLAASGVLAGVLYSLVTTGDADSPWFVAAVAVTAVCALAAGLTAGLVLWPRQRIADDTLPTSLLFYEHIGREFATRHADYRDRLRALLRDEEALVTTLAEQIWATAHVTRTKYRWVGRSIALLLVALAALAVSAALSAAETMR